MRLIVGMILGCALTVGGAYFADATNAGARPLVNWDVVSKTFDGLADTARNGLRKISN